MLRETKGCVMTNAVLKIFCAGLGWLFVALGFLGIFLPLLPTTPFLLLACACFVKGSPRLAQWIQDHPRFGSIITQWREHKAVDKQVKKRANFFIIISFSISIYVLSALWLKLALLVFMITLLVWFNRLPDAESIAQIRENS